MPLTFLSFISLSRLLMFPNWDLRPYLASHKRQFVTQAEEAKKTPVLLDTELRSGVPFKRVYGMEAPPEPHAEARPEGLPHSASGNPEGDCRSLAPFAIELRAKGTRFKTTRWTSSDFASRSASNAKSRHQTVFVGKAIYLRCLGREDLLRAKSFALCDGGIDLRD
jgi:hypothetical protein